MALDYKLTFPKKLEKKEELTEVFNEQNHECFTMYDLYIRDRKFIGGEFEGRFLDLELNESSTILFTLNKFIDPVKTKLAMMKVVYKIVNEIFPEEDYYFDFNGDIVYERRIDGLVERNNKSDFFERLNL